MYDFLLLTDLDDLPVIKENLRKGFLETQSKVNSWISDIKKRLDGDSPEESPPGSARPSNQYARSGNRTATEFENPRRSSRDGGYDADPRVLSDDFTHLELRDNSVQSMRYSLAIWGPKWFDVPLLMIYSSTTSSSQGQSFAVSIFKQAHWPQGII